MNCELCQKEYTSYSGLHGHLTREHKVSQKEYYYFFHPRYDKFNGEKIVFKDRESYFISEFNSKDNLFDWLKQNPKEAKDYAMSLLRNRAERKQDWRLPTQTELKSLFMPSLLGFEKIFGSMDAFITAAQEEGFTTLDYKMPEIQDGELKIFQDTREQTPLSFTSPVTIQKLSCGDYCPNKEFFCDLFIERKSLTDLASTLTQGIDRFKREIERAKSLGFYLIVLTECKYKDLAEYSPNNSFSKKITGAFLQSQIRSLMNNNLQFIFSSSRARSAEIIERIFRMGDAAKTVDLEFLKDKGEL